MHPEVDYDTPSRYHVHDPAHFSLRSNKRKGLMPYKVRTLLNHTFHNRFLEFDGEDQGHTFEPVKVSEVGDHLRL